MTMPRNLEQVDYDPFAQGTFNYAVATTEAQREMFLSVMIGGADASRAYNESISIQLNGNINIEHFNRAIQELINRHDILRSTFNNDGTLLFISNEGNANIQLIDLSSKSAAEQKEWITKREVEEVTEEFDLLNGPLSRFTIAKLSNTESYFIFTAHHIICDGWSTSLLMQELSIYYSDLQQGKNFSQQQLPKFYDYARFTRDLAASAEGKETIDWWKKQYADEIPVTDWPADLVRPANRTFNAKRIDHLIDENLVAALKQYAKSSGVSMVTALLSTFSAFVHRISRQDDVIVGLPSAGQNAEGFAELAGHCVNLLPIRSKVNKGQSFAEYLQERKKALFDSYDHQHFTFGSLLKELSIPRDPSRIPLVPIVFNVDLGFTDGFRFEGANFKFHSNPRHYENFEIFINASGSENKIILECTFNTDLFAPEMMSIRMREYEIFIKQVIENPGAAIQSHDFRAPAEKQLLEQLNNTDFNYDYSSGIHGVISKVAKKYPVNYAAISRDDEYKYKDFEKDTDALAKKLLAKGIKPGSVIGVCLERTVFIPATLVAVLKTNSCYLPLDPEFPADRIRFMIEDSAAAVLITSKGIAEKLKFKENVLILDEVMAEPEVEKELPVFTNPDSPAYYLYTSGSTGIPKGVVIRHRSVVNLIEHFRKELNFQPGQNFFSVTTVSFDISVLEIFLPLMSGGAVYMGLKEESTDGRAIDELKRWCDLHYMQATPATWELLLAQGWKGDKKLVVLCGGEALRKELAEKLLANFKEVHNVYGPTETTVWSTTAIVNESMLSDQRFGSIPLGKPMLNTKIKITDAAGNETPLGVPGQLLIGGDGVAQGYHNRDELNAEKFITLSNGERFYQTGDLVKLFHDGQLAFIQRNDEQVKVRGYRIELGEVESALNKCEGVKQGVVMVSKGNDGDNYLAAYYMTTTGGELDLKTLREQMKGFIPDYMVPSHFVYQNIFPLTPNGKVDRKQLPDPLKAIVEVVEVEEMTESQKQIAAIWEKFLGKRPRLDDDFFDLGGHSLLALQSLTELEKKTGVRLPLATFFKNRTVRMMSEMYGEGDTEAAWKPLILLREGTNKAMQPLFIVHGISGNIFKFYTLTTWMNPERNIYGLQAVGLDGKERPLSTIEEMAARHIDEIKKIQPKGPYALAGGPCGGLIAYEMAIQLKKMGETVNYLALLDLEASDSVSSLPPGIREIRKGQLFAVRAIKRVHTFATANEIERKEYLKKKKEEATKSADEYESWVDRHKLSGTLGEEATRNFKAVEANNYQVIKNYKPGIYEGDAVLFRTEDTYYNNTYTYDLGWKKIIKGNLTILKNSGNHNTMIFNPNASTLALKLDEGLLKAGAK